MRRYEKNKRERLTYVIDFHELSFPGLSRSGPALAHLRDPSFPPATLRVDIRALVAFPGLSDRVVLLCLPGSFPPGCHP